MEERRMRTEDKPQALVHEALNAAAFRSHPYHSPVIGWMNDLESMTWRDARDWYARWYAPNNAFVVVVGDVDALEVLAGVLDGNESARLNQSLVRNSRLATKVGAGYDSTSRGPGMCYLEGSPSQGKSAAELEAG